MSSCENKINPLETLFKSHFGYSPVKTLTLPQG